VENYGSRENQYGDFGWISTEQQKTIGRDALDRIIRWLVKADSYSADLVTSAR
jgi:hypothetical protein